MLALSLLISSINNQIILCGGCCSKAATQVAPLDPENKQELARVVQNHTNTVRRRAMTIPVAQQVQNLRRNRKRTHIGDIPQEDGFLDMAYKLKRRFSEEGKESGAVTVDIKPTGLRVSFSLD